MVPVGESQDDFLIVQVLDWAVVIMDNKGPTDTIWVLTTLMAVIPVRAWLVDLCSSVFAVV